VRGSGVEEEEIQSLYRLSTHCERMYVAPGGGRRADSQGERKRSTWLPPIMRCDPVGSTCTLKMTSWPPFSTTSSCQLSLRGVIFRARCLAEQLGVGRPNV
jgi:hypothetical protein